MNLSTKAGGQTMAFPNVCKVPSPAGPIPTPFPSIGMCTGADAGTCSEKVTCSNKVILLMNTEITSTNGDEAGVGGGLVSGTTSQKATYTMGSMRVEVEGKNVVRFGDMVGSNGSTANAPTGSQIAPSQGKVMVNS